MKVTIDNDANNKTVKVEGRLDTISAPSFDEAVAGIFDADCPGDVTVDCSALEYISSAGLRSLITLLKASKARDRQLTLANVPASIKSILDMTGFSTIFKIS